MKKYPEQRPAVGARCNVALDDGPSLSGVIVRADVGDDGLTIIRAIIGDNVCYILSSECALLTFRDEGVQA